MWLLKLWGLSGTGKSDLEGFSSFMIMSIMKVREKPKSKVEIPHWHDESSMYEGML